jgi:3-hydroxyacyl-CoA dehydrogenase
MGYRMAVNRVSVVGGGTVGVGIAFVHAVAGRDVVVHTRSTDPLARVDRIANDLTAAGYLTRAEASLARQRIRATTRLAEAVVGADHVVEAVPEDLVLKRSVLAELDRLAAADVVVASTTSGLPATALAEYCVHPERVLVARYFLPAYLVPVVEVSPGELTEPTATAAVTALLRVCGLRPLLCRRDLPGGIGPRLQRAVIEEAFRIVGDGVATPSEVDEVLAGAVGPRLGATGIFERLDLTGLDTVAGVLREQGRPVPAAITQRVVRGELGVKSGQGFYAWPADRLVRREREVAEHLATHLPPRPREAPDVVLDPALIEEFLAEARREYESCTPTAPPGCFAVLVGRAEPGELVVERVEFGRNVRGRDPVALAEFESAVVPCFGRPYANTHRGFWCDAKDLLRISRAADAAGYEILGSIHLHPDWHRIGPPEERGLRISHHPTPMDRYMLGEAGWPLNMICYLERRAGGLCHTIGAWNADATQLTVRYRTTPGSVVRMAA